MLRALLPLHLCKAVTALLTCTALGLPFTLNAQDSQVIIRDLNTGLGRVQPSQGILWQITHPRSPHPSYLYALLPRMRVSTFRFPSILDSLAPHCERLVMGIDPDVPPTDGLLRGEMPLDSTLEDLLPRRTFRQLKRFVADSLSAVSQYKLIARFPPSVLARQFMADYCLDQGEAELHVLTEYQLKHRLSLPTEILHTGWTRIAWLDSQPLEVQTEALVRIWESRQVQCARYEEMVQAYLRGDLDRVWFLSRKVPDLGSNPGNLIEARNDIWLRYLRDSLETASLLLAIPAPQLAGEYGLLHQLRKHGYYVQPMVSDLLTE